MISSAAWGEKVEQALHDFVGKRYLIVSKESGARGGKPIKKLLLAGLAAALNQTPHAFMVEALTQKVDEADWLLDVEREAQQRDVADGLTVIASPRCVCGFPVCHCGLDPQSSGGVALDPGSRPG